MNKSELHIIILWHNARYKEEDILNDINKKLKIIECIDITWSSESISENFTRFYGIKLTSESYKEQECGRGSFLLVTVIDENPVYEFVETSRGFEYVNMNIFKLKQLYRSLTNGGCKIHTTNTPKETNHDITLLLGKNYDDYLKSAPQQWNGEIRCIKRNLTGGGVSGWNSIEELFYTLNATTNYVVLRGLETLPEAIKQKSDSDIDILTGDYKNLCFIINGKPEINETRPHFLTKIGDGFIYLDVWNIKKNYYDLNWAKAMLADRQQENGIFTLNQENAFYEFIYHVTMHKKKAKNEYIQTAYKLAEKYGLNLNVNEDITQFDTYFELLKEFMHKNNYSFVKPFDKTVFYNEANLKMNEEINWLNENYFIKDLKPYKIADRGASNCCYYTGFYNGEKVFIKTGGYGIICQNEFKTTKILYDNDNNNFLKPYFYKVESETKNVVLEFIDGSGLDKLIEKNQLTKEQKDYIAAELEKIAKTLINSKIVHRDITPGNLILTADNKLKLIDTQWAVYFDNYYEDEYVKNNPETIRALGSDFAKGQFIWDDMYSISKILELIERKSDFVSENIGKYVISAENFGKDIVYKNFFEHIFSVKNSRKNTKRKIITLMGIKISLKKQF